jgi:arylsulfatase
MISNPSKYLPSALFLIGLVWLLSLAAPANGQEILPFPPTPSASTAGLTMQDSIYQKRIEPKRLAADAPNILIILMDDVGPGTPSTYGGEINTAPSPPCATRCCRSC